LSANSWPSFSSAVGLTTLPQNMARLLKKTALGCFSRKTTVSSVGVSMARIMLNADWYGRAVS